MPRKTGKAIAHVSKEQAALLNTYIPGFSVDGWTVDRLGRAYLLMDLDPSDKDKYFKSIENLFLAAEMGELVALYSALPLLAYPEIWIKRCSEGIRSNIANVLEALMYGNPYPAKYLDESAGTNWYLKHFLPIRILIKLRV
ncbi:EboA domain-containing protein [Mucilaginibacter sp. S1162]|uniref:EboA domain-containing protein n=1 Tax=Mucilaginibacter humi TaxID=2732510 RepID=A0ABX1W6U7_9SPHI|nr:EboA domain-containing protein [Mucilaginibacter humi]NNU34441.1 EboA domain-containing protein [Mucilaginibacter humi]